MPISFGVGQMSNAVSLYVRTDFTGITSSLKTLKRKIGSAREPLKNVAVNYMARREIKKRFIAGGTPRWKKLSESTIERRKSKEKKYHGDRPLLLTGALRESATGGKGFFIKFKPSTKPTSVTIGSSLDYAVAHDNPRGTYFNTGRSEIPGRPWSQVTQKNANDMRDMVMSWVQKKIRESGIKGI